MRIFADAWIMWIAFARVLISVSSTFEPFFPILLWYLDYSDKKFCKGCQSGSTFALSGEESVHALVRHDTLGLIDS